LGEVLRRIAGLLLVALTPAVCVGACAADPAPAPVVVLDLPKAAPSPAPAEPPRAKVDRAEEDDTSEPADGGAFELSFSGSFTTGDGGIDFSFGSSGDGGITFSGSFGSDGGVLSFGSQRQDAGAPAQPRSGQADGGAKAR
jgi:hypothetical protein